MKQVLVFVLLLLPTLALAQVNTSSDDYACAFRTPSPGRMELWITSGRITVDGRSRAIYIAPCFDTGFGALAVAPSPINQSGAKPNDVVLDGTPSFSSCDPSFGVFASNRLVDGKFYGNDIYSVKYTGGSWQVTRLKEVCSHEWDDSPALDPTGVRLYFASDRMEPGTRRAHLFMSEREGDHWSEPRMLLSLAGRFSTEETPFVGEDGFLYYSSNRSGDYDIYRVRLGQDGMPEGNSEAVAGVNSKGSDQTHPCISPGGSYLLFSSNAGAGGGRKSDFDIVWVKVAKRSAPVEIDVRKRRRQTTERTTAALHVITNRQERILRSTSEHPITLALTDLISEPRSPAQDSRLLETILFADPDSTNFVTAHDTVISARNCVTGWSHTLFLWDTATYYEQRCVDTFPIKKVQYFVTGYWCPTTKRYASFLECPSLFMDSACLIPACAPGQLDSFAVQRIRLHSECIDYSEFDRRGPQFAAEVDDALEQHLRAMESAFGSACMKRTIAQKKPVTVIVEGFTDPRAFASDCHYFGPDIDFSRSFVQVADSVKDHFRHDTRMKKYGFGGNQLLSELRAYNLAVLLDRLWTENIPLYRSLKEQGLLQTLAIGRAVSQDDISFEQRRSAQVSVNAESEGVADRGSIPQPGERVVVCTTCK